MIIGVHPSSVEAYQVLLYCTKINKNVMFSKKNITRFSLSVENEQANAGRDGRTEPVSLDQILRRERGQGNIIFPVQLTTSRIGNLYPVDP